MTANHIFLVVLAALFFLSLLVQTMSIKWGLKWAAVAEVSLIKALGLYFLFLGAGLLAGVMVGLSVAFTFRNLTALPLNLIGLVVQYIAACLIIIMVYRVKFERAAKAVVPFIVVGVAILLVCTVALHKFAYEAFLIPTNGMAPTLLGEHWEARCPRCGAPAYSSPIDSKAQFVVDGALMVCSKERRSVTVTDLPKVRAGGDRILVCKLLAPKRWDVAVFRYPAEPSFKYVQRIVGMPGEKLEIREGAVWIDGKKLDPPESIRGIHYSPTIESHGRTYSGPGSVPVELGPDEYFTLGDFADASSDSRLWENGAPGHPSYAVPESNIVGVVINIYWPPSRWTSFR